MPRIKSIDNFKRPSKIRETNKKYFFALEGVSTEVDYLKGLIKDKKPNSYSFYFYRNKKVSESNNIYKMLDSILEYIDYESEFNLMYEDLVNIILKICNKNNYVISEIKLSSKIESYLSKIGKNMHDAIDKNEIEGITQYLNSINLFNDMSSLIRGNDLIKLISKRSTFDSLYDQIVIIGDRDKESFTSLQYDLVLSMVEHKNVKLIITNPCIEFWFLLHFSDCLDIDKTNWYEKDAAKYVLKDLKSFDLTYRKNHFDVQKYILRTDIALSNLKYYSSDIFELKEEFGSNMNELIKITENM